MLTQAELVRRARRMRKNMTPAEVLLWSQLRRKQIDGFKFRRQHILHPHIVDFCCASERLVVEVDGTEHRGESAQQHDDIRDAFLVEEYGVRIMRLDNSDIELSLDEVITAIREALGGG